MANWDSAAKRRSGINMTSPWRAGLSIPDGSIDRQTFLFGYSGISWFAALAGATGAVVLLPFRLISGVYTTAGVTASRALQNLRSFLPNKNVPVLMNDGTMQPQWYRYHQMFVDVFLGGAGAYTLQDILTAVETSQANATQQATLTAAIAQQAQATAEAASVIRQVAVDNSLTGAEQIPPIPLSYGMEP